MSVNPHPTRPGEYIIDCRPYGYKGKRYRINYKGTEAQALAVESDIMRKPQVPKTRKALSIAQLVPDFKAYYKHEVQPSTYDDACTCFKKLLPVLGKVRPNLLTQRHIDMYKAQRVQEVKKRTVNKELSYLSRLLGWAEERGYIVKVPFRIKGYPAKQAKAPEPRPLSAEDITLIYGSMEPQYKLIFLLMADAGLRRSEATHLKTEDVYLDHGVLRVTGKGKKQRVVPIMTDRLRTELTACVDKGGEYLVVNPKTDKPYYGIRKALARAVKAAGLSKHVYHHLLRHTFGTVATTAGMALEAVQKTMGHSDPSTTMIYQHLAADYLKSEGRKFTVHVDKKNKKKKPSANS